MLPLPVSRTSCPRKMRTRMKAEGNRSQKIAESGGEKNTHRCLYRRIVWPRATRPRTVVTAAEESGPGQTYAVPAVCRASAGRRERVARGQHNPALLQPKACNLGVPRAAPHRLALVQEELAGGHRTKLKGPHRGQFLLQALKHRVGAVALAPVRRAGAASTRQSQMRAELVFFSRNAKASRSLIHRLCQSGQLRAGRNANPENTRRFRGRKESMTAK